MKESDVELKWQRMVKDMPNILFGRRFQCVREVDHLPSGFFPTLLHRILSNKSDLNVEVHSNVCFLRNTKTDSCLMIYLSVGNDSEPSFIDLVCCGSSNGATDLLKRVFDLIEIILKKYSGLSMNRFALCTHCLCDTKYRHCLHRLEPQSKPLLQHVKQIDRDDYWTHAHTHRLDCWGFTNENACFPCGDDLDEVCGKELLIGPADEKVFQ